jgi:hypothetical protein
MGFNSGLKGLRKHWLHLRGAVKYKPEFFFSQVAYESEQAGMVGY